MTEDKKKKWKKAAAKAEKKEDAAPEATKKGFSPKKMRSKMYGSKE